MACLHQTPWPLPPQKLTTQLLLKEECTPTFVGVLPKKLNLNLIKPPDWTNYQDYKCEGPKQVLTHTTGRPSQVASCLYLTKASWITVFPSGVRCLAFILLILLMLADDFLLNFQLPLIIHSHLYIKDGFNGKSGFFGNALSPFPPWMAGPGASSVLTVQKCKF